MKLHNVVSRKVALHCCAPAESSVVSRARGSQNVLHVADLKCMHSTSCLKNLFNMLGRQSLLTIREAAVAVLKSDTSEFH